MTAARLRAEVTHGTGPAMEPLEGRTFLTAAHGFVYTPHATVAGKSLGQWAAEWVKWLYKTPASQNAVTDKTGSKAYTNQPNDAFFLAGTLDGSKVSRKVTVPAGKPLFFPVVNSFWINIDKAIPGVQETPDPPFDSNLAGIKANLDATFKGITSSFATVDGNPVYGMSTHRETYYGSGFPVTFASKNVFGLPAGSLGKKSMTTGIYLMIKPLSVGTHTIHFGGVNKFYNPDASQDNTYTITVKAPTTSTAAKAVPVKVLAGSSVAATLDDTTDD